MGAILSGRVITLILLSVFSVTVVKAQPSLPAVVADPAPVIDGDISDACWQKSPSVTDFYFPEDGAKAAETTTAWLCYDAKAIYLAFYCKDSQPDKIVAQQKKRGGDIDTDDWVGFDLDCFCNYRQIIWFDATVGGVQMESLQTGDVTKIEWKGDWSTAARRVSDGYTVEIAVPFSILQYDSSRTSMGIAFIRRHARLNQWWWSPYVGADYDARKFYLWEGLKLPRPVTRPMLMGYSLIGTGADGDSRRVGLDIKHALTPSLTGAITVNPYFGNVEQQVESIDFTYTERWLGDQRPFFQEGSGFLPSSDIFYSRRIEDVDVGAKVYGKHGPYNLALLHSRQFGDEDHTVVQIGREFAGRGVLWLAGTQSNVPGGNNSVARTSGHYWIYRNNQKVLELYGKLLVSDSGSSSGKDYFLRLSSGDRPRELGWQLNYQRTDADFDPLLGYVPEKNLRGWGGYLWYYDERSQGSVAQWGLNAGVSLIDRIGGALYYDSYYLGADCEWRDGRQAHLGLNRSHRPPYRDQTMRLEYEWGGRDLYKRGGIGFALGRQAGGSYLSYGGGQGWRISDRLSIQANYEHSRIKPPSPLAYTAGQWITTLAYDIDSERTLAGRSVLSKGNTNVYLAYRQRVRRGVDAYVIFGDPNAQKTRSSFVLKLVSLL